MRIFLIEDDDHLRSLLKTFLEIKGHEVFAASDPTGCPAYDSDEESCVHLNPCGDALIIDQSMPKMKGLEFIQQQIERGCKGAVQNKAIMSARLTQEEAKLAAQLGCTIFSKPFQLNSLHEWLESVEKRLNPDRELINF
jgi:DNA-binding response OmpR family regulator